MNTPESKYNLYLYRELFAENVPSSECEVLCKGRILIHKNKVYGVNGIHHFGNVLMVGLFDRSDLSITDARVEHISEMNPCPVCDREWRALEDGSMSLRHTDDCAHMNALKADWYSRS